MSELETLLRPSSPSRRRTARRRPEGPGVEGPVSSPAPRVEPETPPVRFRRPRGAAPAASPAPAKVDRRPPPPVFHPLAYRSVVAAWSLEHRERWGRRSNELEDAGLSWRDAETQAFVEVWNALRRAGGFGDPDRQG